MNFRKFSYYIFLFVFLASCNTTSKLDSNNSNSTIDTKKTSPFAIEDNSNGAVKPKTLVARPKGK